MSALVLLQQRKEQRGKDAEMGKPGEVMNHVMKHIDEDYSFHFSYTTELAVELCLNWDRRHVNK